MNNLTKVFYIIIFSTLLSGCLEDMTITIDTEEEPESELVSEQEPETELPLEPETELPLEPETELVPIEVVYSEQEFEVQFDQSLLIPLNSAKDTGETSAKNTANTANTADTASVTLISFPSLGEVSISESAIKYTPTGMLGDDSFTISIDDNITVYEQTFELLISDRSPNLVLSNPTDGSYNDLEHGVTVWGYNLGETQGNNTIELCDLSQQCTEIQDIISWENAGDNLPNTLENLNATLGIQEVNFHIPEVSAGDKLIQISNQFGTTTLPFILEPKVFEVTFVQSQFNVQFDDAEFYIPLDIVADEGSYPLVSLLGVTHSDLGEAVIIDDMVIDGEIIRKTIKYIPSGVSGSETLTLYISDAWGEKEVTQTFELSIADRAPHLAFSDLISGPSSGLGDGKGSGVIVTLWGFKLGNAQNSSTIELCDLNNTCTEAANVYYWKDADGVLPSGPANLYESHGMQEIAFSIPNISNGEKQIKVSNEFGSSTLPFTVRDGKIYHVMSTGSDDLGDGTFYNPYLTIAAVDSLANSGSTIYIHTLTEGDENEKRAIYNNRNDAMSTEGAQFSYIAYPNTRVTLIGEMGFETYNGYRGETSGFVLSKLSVYAAAADEDEDSQATNKRSSTSFGIVGSKNGRAVGNYITDAHPDDITGACASARDAAIVGTGISGDRVSNFKIYGNHIHDYGCDGSSRLQHTTYMTIRSADFNDQLVAPEMAWNYLQDNKASAGLHYFDANQNGEECGQFITPFEIHNNVVINQAGAAISFSAVCPVNTTFEYYNNVAINVGLKADFNDDKTVGYDNPAVTIWVNHEGVTAKLNFNNNIFYKWSTDGEPLGPKSCIGFNGAYANAEVTWNNNVCYTELDLAFIYSPDSNKAMESKISGSNNVWYSPFTDPINAIVPSWDSNPIVTDPLLKIQDSKVTLSSGSPLIGASEVPLIGKSEKPLLRDIYGRLREANTTVGAIEFIND